MTRTTIDVDPDALDASRVELGRGCALSGFNVIRDIDGTPAQVERQRWERFAEQAEVEPVALDGPAS